jgi:hypothetical protein
MGEKMGEFYKKEYIKRSVESLVKLIEEKGVSIKCSINRKIISDVEVVVIRCIDYTTFPTSEVSIPIVATQELEHQCKCKTIEYVKEYLSNNEVALVDAVFKWIRCQNCKAEKLWEILSSLGLNNIISFDQVVNLFIPDLSILR